MIYEIESLVIPGSYTIVVYEESLGIPDNYMGVVGWCDGAG